MPKIIGEQKAYKAAERRVRFESLARQGERQSASHYERIILEHCLSEMPDRAFSHESRDLFFIRLYEAELAFNPWGIFIQHTIGRIRPYRDDGERRLKAVRFSTVPRFLQPTHCPVCTESLGFTAYPTSSKSFTHVQCADSWRKTLAPKHERAMAILDQPRPDRLPYTDDEIALLFSSYVELTPLYPMPYVQRFRLIPAYAQLPGTWPETPYVTREEYRSLIQMPFWNPRWNQGKKGGRTFHQDFTIEYTEAVDIEAVEPARPPSRELPRIEALASFGIRHEGKDIWLEKPSTLTLSELEAIFVHNPKPGVVVCSPES